MERTLGQPVIAGVTYLRHDETRPGAPRQKLAALSVPLGIVALDAPDASWPTGKHDALRSWLDNKGRIAPLCL